MKDNTQAKKQFIISYSLLYIGLIILGTIATSDRIPDSVCSYPYCGRNIHDSYLKKANSPFEIVKDKHGFVIGGMSGVNYKEYELQLKPGSKLFVYTDGLPEATDHKNNMFTVNRMLQSLNRHKMVHRRKFCKKSGKMSIVLLMGHHSSTI